MHWICGTWISDSTMLCLGYSAIQFLIATMCALGSPFDIHTSSWLVAFVQRPKPLHEDGELFTYFFDWIYTVMLLHAFSREFPM